MHLDAEGTIPQPDLRTIWSIAWPMMLSYVSVPIMGFTSVAVMGHLGHPRYLAGVGLATSFFAYFYFVFAFIRWSTSGLSAQAKGRLATFGGHNDLAIILARSMTLGVYSRPAARHRASGIRGAAVRGTHGGRRPVVINEKLKRTHELIAKGLSVREAALKLRIGKTALYSALLVLPKLAPPSQSQ